MKVDYLPFTELLSDIIDNRGRTCPTVENGIPLIATNCITNDLLYPAYEKVRYISQEIYDTWFRGHPKPGDLIFVTKGTPGRVCMAPNPIDFCIAQDMVAVRADNAKVYPKYLFAVLRANEIQNQIENMHVGTLIPHFKKSDFDKLLLPVPNRETQEVIGDMYFNFSTKIELNRRMNRTLESLARTVFRHWFVESEKTDGWKVGDVYEIADVTYGAPFSSSLFTKDRNGLPVIRIRDFTDHFPQIYTTEQHPKGTIITAGDVIVGMDGEFRVHHWKGPNALLNQRMCFFKPKYGIPRIFVAESIREHLEFFERSKVGTTVIHLGKSDIDTFRIIIPPENLLRKFGDISEPLLDKIVANAKESRTLAELRDALLPKLMRGEVRVKEVETL